MKRHESRTAVGYRTDRTCDHRPRLRWSPLASLLLSLLAGTAWARGQPDTLETGFENPPASARPRVWWHWMNGNITEEGIRLDLEWMHRIGIAGFQQFDAALATPQVVDKRLVYMTPEWQRAFKYAITSGMRLDMEEAIASSPGWSETGGPWVPPAQAMKKYVWTTTSIEGGKPFTGTLAHPPSVSGAFQDLGIHDFLGPPEGASPIPQYYADAFVVAYRRPDTDVSLQSLHPKVTASAGSPDGAMLYDGDLLKMTRLPIPATVGGSVWIQYEFSAPQAIRSLTCVMKEVNVVSGRMLGLANPSISIQASDDGQHYREIARVLEGGTPQHTVSFPTLTAKFFRVVFTRRAPPPLPAYLRGLDPGAMGIKRGPVVSDYEIAELAFNPGARVNRFEDKAGFAPMPDLYQFATPAFERAAVVDRSDVINLTGKMRSDGRLDWNPPAGHWVVLRFGYSLLGITNHPATAEATGLEVDKLNARYVKRYMDGYLKSYEKAVGPSLVGRHGIRYVVTDSWEAGSQNWTDDMIGEFRRRRGYDPLPWTPVLAGVVVGSSASSDRFLWDFRKTIADLIAEEHYGQVQASLKEHGLGHYGESHEVGRALLADGMEVKKLADIPMSAMWVQAPGTYDDSFGFDADDRESASVAHLYGQNLVAAESMTASVAAWAWSPATLKPVADQEFLNGINCIVIHESAHQPLVGAAPGLTLGPFGQWFNRNETWAEQARPWTDYLARTSYLLQQGRFAADLLYFYGEDSNLTAIFQDSAPGVPPGYGFDYVNADGLIHEFSVRDGKITSRSGMTYSVLGLDPYSRHMSLPVLRAIHKLVLDGAVVVGGKPVDDPSLADDLTEFKRLDDELFGDGTGVHRVGKGSVYAGQTPAQAFAALSLAKDFDYSGGPQDDARLLYVHRRLADGEIYFVDNRSDHEATVEASFRVVGKAPSLWHAESAGREQVSFRIAEGRTKVPLHLEPWGTVFVVFRDSTKELSRRVAGVTERQIASLEGPWKVDFQPGRGAPESITLQTLGSWSDDTDVGVKYFSGTATYHKTFEVPADWISGHRRLVLDLGGVKNLAEVSVNGRSLGIVWHAPYRVEVSSALKPGVNELAVRVTNSWVNRLIGDQQAGVTRKYAVADVTPYGAGSPLQGSGLLGPVVVYSVVGSE